MIRLIRPSRDEFRALARDHSVVPVWQELLADLTTPVAAFARVVGDEPGFLLESVEHGERWGRWSFVGRRPTATLIARGGRLEVDGIAAGVGPPRPGRPRRPRGPPRRLPVAGARRAAAAARRRGRLPRLRRGPRGRAPARRPARRPRPSRRHPLGHRPAGRLRPLAPAGDADRLGADSPGRGRRRRRSTTSTTRPWPGWPRWPRTAPGPSTSRCRAARPRGRAARRPPADQPRPSTRPAVEAAREHILAGDIFQVVLAQRFDLDLDADPFDLYRALRQVNPSPYMYFLRHPELDVVGSSPEPMVQLLDGRVISRPIAGTRRRGRTDEEDRRMAGELSEHPKEIAEHVMLVDLARNDVGRVVEFGTEQVDELMTLERYSHVMHLTSQVSGRLAGRARADRRAAGHPPGRHGVGRAQGAGHGDHRRARAGQAGPVRRAWSATSTSPATSTRPSPSGPCSSTPDGRATVQAGAGIVADSRPGPRGPRVPQQGGRPPRRRPRRPPHHRGPGQAGRLHVVTDLSCDYRLLRDDVGAVRLDRDVVRVRRSRRRRLPPGPMQPGLAALAVGGSAWSLVLQPQGKIDALVRVDPGGRRRRRARHRRRLGRRRCSPGSTGSSCGSRPTSSCWRGRAWPCGPRRGRGGRDRGRGRRPAGGRGTAGPGCPASTSSARSPAVPPGVAEVALEAYQVARIEAGVPVMGAELTERTIPAETGLIERTVSFTKGCYTGQELVARIDSRGGHVPRHLRGVVVDGAVVPAGGGSPCRRQAGRDADQLARRSRAEGRSASATSAARSSRPPTWRSSWEGGGRDRVGPGPAPRRMIIRPGWLPPLVAAVALARVRPRRQPLLPGAPGHASARSDHHARPISPASSWPGCRARPPRPSPSGPGGPP